MGRQQGAPLEATFFVMCLQCDYLAPLATFRFDFPSSNLPWDTRGATLEGLAADTFFWNPSPRRPCGVPAFAGRGGRCWADGGGAGARERPRPGGTQPSSRVVGGERTAAGGCFPSPRGHVGNDSASCKNVLPLCSFLEKLLS